MFEGAAGAQRPHCRSTKLSGAEKWPLTVLPPSRPGPHMECCRRSRCSGPGSPFDARGRASARGCPPVSPVRKCAPTRRGDEESLMTGDISPAQTAHGTGVASHRHRARRRPAGFSASRERRRVSARSLPAPPFVSRAGAEFCGFAPRPCRGGRRPGLLACQPD